MASRGQAGGQADWKDTAGQVSPTAQLGRQAGHTPSRCGPSCRHSNNSSPSRRRSARSTCHRSWARGSVFGLAFSRVFCLPAGACRDSNPSPRAPMGLLDGAWSSLAAWISSVSLGTSAPPGWSSRAWQAAAEETRSRSNGCHMAPIVRNQLPLRLGGG